MGDVQRVIEQLELVVGRAEGVVDGEDLEWAARHARQARSQLGFQGSTLLVALVGGTGVGKSSLLNAIAGDRVATTGVLRPHTQAPLAWVPEEAEPSLRALLRRIGVTDVVPQRSLPGVAIVDMVDIDSVVEGHRRTVEGALPFVDVAVWVTDPIKYTDSVLHREFLSKIGGGLDRHLFVVNRMDLVDAGRREGVLAGFRALLEGDGITGLPIFATASDPPGGAPEGIGVLVDHLRERLDEKTVRLRRVLERAAAIASRVADEAGLAGASMTGFDDAWERWTDQARASTVAGGLRLAPRERLLLDLERLVVDVSVAAGPSLGRTVRSRFPSEAVESAFTAAAARVTGVGGRFDGDRLVASVTESLAAPLREMLWPRATLVASLAELSVALEAAEARLHRTVEPAV